MRKRPYRSVGVKVASSEDLVTGAAGRPVVFGVDVAKNDFYAAIMLQGGEVLRTVKWKHPVETPEFVGLVREFAVSGVTVALESSGSYGAVLIDQLRQGGVQVFLVNSKRVHDAKECYDGVASKQDAKDAAVIADLHWRGKSSPYPQRSAEERALRATVQTLSMYKNRYEAGLNRLEAVLAEVWPELTELLPLHTRSILALLEQTGGPAGVREQPVAARETLQRSGRGALPAARIDAIVRSAEQTLGVHQVAAERHLLQTLAADAQQALEAAQEVEKLIHEASKAMPDVIRMGAVVGLTTAAIIVADGGRVERFSSAQAFVKTLGLNLTPYSSGSSVFRSPKLSKRGPPLL